MKAYWIIALMTFLASIGSVFLKKAVCSGGIADAVKSRGLYIGGVIYVIALLLNVYAMRMLDYSVVLALSSLTYIWTIFTARLFLKERITASKIIGTILIIIGAMILTEYT